MLTSLLLLASTAGLAAPSATQDPPIHIWYSSDGAFAYGDRAKVYARAAESGYLVVLRANLKGQVRVLAPVDPDDDQHVSAGKKYELKGRGGREAFVTEDTSGQGIVLAAWSKTPFTFDRYVKDGRWDLDALSGQGPQSDDADSRSPLTAHRIRLTKRSPCTASHTAPAPSPPRSRSARPCTLACRRSSHPGLEALSSGRLPVACRRTCP
jgi:hypothetical protein